MMVKRSKQSAAAVRSARGADSGTGPSRWRAHLLLTGFALMAVALVCRAVDLEVLKRDFLQGQGDARHLR
jgi:cell division protein FtsI (penicillin-binding protein 3)